MAKNLKLHIKNVQIAGAINLNSLKAKLSKKKEGEEAATISEVEEAGKKTRSAKARLEPKSEATAKKAAPKKAHAKEAEVIAEENKPVAAQKPIQEKIVPEKVVPEKAQTEKVLQEKVVQEKVLQEKLVQEKLQQEKLQQEKAKPTLGPVIPAKPAQPPTAPESAKLAPPQPQKPAAPGGIRPSQPTASRPPGAWRSVPPQRFVPPTQRPAGPPQPRLGPVSRPGPGARPGPGERPAAYPHKAPYKGPHRPGGPPQARHAPPFARPQPPPQQKPEARAVPEKKEFSAKEIEEGLFRRSKVKPKETPAKPLRKIETKEFEVRIRHGLRGDEEEEGWRKRRPSKHMRALEAPQEIVRPTKIAVRLPISVKDLASEMKLKASQLISKLFLQGQVLTLNDMLVDEVVIQLLGNEFGCDISIDTKEEERIRITDKTLLEEISASDQQHLQIRPPVVTFMGHVDHGKTSLIDAIRKSNTAQHEVGAITQHIGAFRVSTPQGDIAVLDTPGHEAFSHMRERGAEVTDIVVLVIAGDEGIKQQTEEALAQAKASKATIVVALNKCDKPAFNADNVFRQLADRELLPEAWGGQTITVNTSAVTGQGIPDLLEMLALQAEVLELRANPEMRARGTVIESEVEKGLGPVATVLVQNGTLRLGDSLVFGFHWARVKTMKDELGRDLTVAGPSTPVRINGLSGLPESGEEFIVVKSEREARDISQARQEGRRTTTFQAKRRGSLESMMEQAQEGAPKKVLNLIIRADVQGSSEALKNALEKIVSKKVEVNILSSGVGMISESDVQLALASKATIIGFHTQIESHVESSLKELGVQVRMHDIIYHAIDEVRGMMLSLLDKIEQARDVGKAEVKATFKSSQLGIIAGCQVLDGTITRSNQVRVMREGNQLFKGPISSLKRHKEDVREVTKGAECGILLQGYSDYQPGDILEAFEITYLAQEL